MGDAARILWDVVEEHLDEAEFLVEQWERAAISPAYTAADIVRVVERRLMAHLDGIVVADEPASVRLLQPGLIDAGAGASRATACALALLGMSDASAVPKVLGAVVAAESAALRGGLARALALADRPGLGEAVRDALYSVRGASFAQVAFLEVLAARQTNPGPLVLPALQSDDPAAVLAALDAAILCRPEDIGVPILETLLASPDRDLQSAAMELAVTWGLRAGWLRCVDLAQQGNPRALVLTAALGGPGELQLVLDALSVPAYTNAALVALGYGGRREAIEASLALLGAEDKLTARLAGEAFCAITGMEPKGPALRGEPDDAEAELPPLERDLQQNLEPTPEDDLPLLNGEVCAAWWRERESAFQPGWRYLHGSLAGPATVEGAMQSIALRRVPLVSLELQARSGGRLLLPRVQFGWAAKARAALGGEVMARLDLQGHVRWA